MSFNAQVTNPMNWEVVDDVAPEVLVNGIELMVFAEGRGVAYILLIFVEVFVWQ